MWTILIYCQSDRMSFRKVELRPCMNCSARVNDRELNLKIDHEYKLSLSYSGFPDFLWFLSTFVYLRQLIYNWVKFTNMESNIILTEQWEYDISLRFDMFELLYLFWDIFKYGRNITPCSRFLLNSQATFKNSFDKNPFTITTYV